MKLRIFLMIVVLAVMIISANISQIICLAFPSVYVVYPIRSVYSESISVSGTIENNAQSEIALELPVIADEIYVKPGDRVTAGQKLFTIDKDATVNVILGSAALKSLLPSYINEQALLQAFAGSGSSPVEEFIDSDKIPTAIYATSDGILSQMNISTTDLSDPTKPIAVIATDNGYSAIITIDEENISKVSLGNNAEITGPGLGNATYDATVTYISSSAKTVYSGVTKKTVVNVGLKINHPDTLLKVGYSVKARVFTSPAREILMVPYECVMQDNDGTEYVYVLKGNLASRRDIVTGSELSDGFEVVSGLLETDRLVKNPASVSFSPMLVIPRKEGETD